MDTTETKPAAYELFTQGTGGMFLTADFGNEKRALPLLALQSVTASTDTEGERLVLEFTHENLEIAGHGLGELFDHLTLGRVKTVRVGASAKIHIQKLTLLNG
jgi:hypothetical protein